MGEWQMFIEYGKLSTMLYQLTKPVGYSINGDIEYYEEQLAHCQGRVLEAGVGTGRMLIPLLKKGLMVDGVDLSAPMLEQCRANLKKENDNAVLYQADLTELDLQEKYEAIIMPTGSFGLLPRSSVKKVLASFYHHLERNGQVIIDLELPISFVPNQTKTYHYPLNSEQGILFTETSQEMDWYNQKVSYIHRYEWVKEGIVEQTELSHFILCWYGMDEFSALLYEAGFQSVRHEIGYGKDKDASLLTFFAEK